MKERGKKATKKQTKKKPTSSCSEWPKMHKLSPLNTRTIRITTYRKNSTCSFTFPTPCDLVGKSWVRNHLSFHVHVHNSFNFHTSFMKYHIFVNYKYHSIRSLKNGMFLLISEKVNKPQSSTIPSR